MVERKLYNIGFEPIVQPEEYLKFFPEGKLKNNNIGVKVIMVYPLPYLVIDLADANHLNTSVTTTESSEVEIDELYMDANELAQYRIVPIDDFMISYLASPKAQPYFNNKNSVFGIQAFQDDARTNPAVEKLQLNELFHWEDQAIWAKAKANLTTLTTARIAVFGYRFICEPVSSFPNGIRPLSIPISGYGSK